MAIPVESFSKRYGIALMRHNGVDWSFVAWVGNGATIVEELAPGSYTYQIWLIIGSAFSATLHTQPQQIESVRLTGISRISALRAKK